VSWKPFARVLVRKGERALKSARHNLKDGNYDSAVNRAYYAMFDIARAALLKVGVAEDKLPRTHNGVSEAFWIHAVHSGLVDRQLAAELSRTESLRIKADYTDLEIEPNIAAEVVERAELCQARENWLHLRQQKIDGAGPTLVTEQRAKPKKT
jgi:uncharacterized protein (UPF0332 family)